MIIRAGAYEQLPQHQVPQGRGDYLGVAGGAVHVEQARRDHLHRETGGWQHRGAGFRARLRPPLLLRVVLAAREDPRRGCQGHHDAHQRSEPGTRGEAREGCEGREDSKGKEKRART